jgi:hypothetical protein
MTAIACAIVDFPFPAIACAMVNFPATGAFSIRFSEKSVYDLFFLRRRFSEKKK